LGGILFNPEDIGCVFLFFRIWIEVMDVPITGFDLKGRLALITGGGRGLGLRMARALATYGANVVLTSRDADSARAAAQEIADSCGVQAIGFGMDVTKPESLEAVRAAVHDALGAPDILVNNAGGTPDRNARHLFQRKPEDIRALLDVNLYGTLLATRAFAPAMADKGYGKVINVASIAGMIGRDRRLYDSTGLLPQPVDYAAAKAGVLGFTVDCAGLLAPSGVRVNAISPGGFERTNMPTAFRDAYADRTALGRMGDVAASDLDGAVVYLASAASDYVTGINLVVDGGFHFWK
jgi:NAD(P)-dependent dehydrogenase (short-subunit alcohol dehydrogenase family)